MQLAKIKVPTFVIGARCDNLNPACTKWMSTQFPKGRYLYCAKGSHMCLYDDQKTWFNGVIHLIKDVHQGK